MQAIDQQIKVIDQQMQLTHTDKQNKICIKSNQRIFQDLMAVIKTLVRGFRCQEAGNASQQLLQKI